MFDQLKWLYYTILAGVSLGAFAALHGLLKTDEQEVKLASINGDAYVFALVDPKGYNEHIEEPCTITSKASWKFLHEHKGTTYKADVRFRPFDKVWNHCTLTKVSEEHFQQALASFSQL
ncbi:MULTISPECIES: hypothetical protein [Pseudoalteromonas]|uniref:Uncharacterized protein n=1 Tax=Pseudoalteromonas amylolytica TaxID=1859457 RepID=A0A1S1MSP7_9GAMM|nr:MULTISPECIES: hypothetical protein [Pseudoalteromonas]OHU85513.1 hypothetical protein BFC16_19385 [Pseudoalteromonas sp. JW3]OHU91747.1 hypothetical protein BET10_08080 [Pseudoalteromonas amylolytica]